MALSPLDSLPDTARVWVFGANRQLAHDEVDRLREELGRFLESWTAHRHELAASFDLPYRQFLVVALDESRVPASGCSVDALVRRLKEVEAAWDLMLTDGASVWYRDENGRVVTVSRPEFRRRAERGEVSPETTVFDLTVDRLGVLRSGGWERPARSSWHARLLDPSPAAAGRRDTRS